MAEAQESSNPSVIEAVPTTIVYPKSPSSSSVIPPELLGVMQANPTDAMALLKEVVAQEYTLRKTEAANRHNIEIAKTTRQANADRAAKNNLRLLIAAIAGAFFASLGYGVAVKDSSLADKVFTGAMGILGGGGGVALLSKKNEEKEKP